MATTKTAPRRVKFPKAAERSEAKPVVLCTSERVLKLYNQDSGKEAKRISKAVRTWFSQKAVEEGWDGVAFVPEVQSQHGAGCVLGKNFDGQKASTTLKKLNSEE
ncbi:MULTISPECIES: hypothetical protein [Stenotrophomonas maltophilia group]|nr:MULTISPECIES: hypothetical protein [Stenotrophomonas maltophilia group]MCI1131109.1 hypothetical protein [Stenotrophomonas maltophilia]MCZ7844398.1 hypothetical protein [Stenotrophomonas maltophilia]MDJ1624456.1 hypothetical protein [Stenotrophomonas sepilia]PZT35338.1 hypothetical protein A7X97_00830 [Stenotrophomonas sepilia]